VVKKAAPAEERAGSAATLAAAVKGYGQRPPDPANPRLPAIRALFAQLRPAYHAEKDALVKIAIASALAELHLLSHALYKPDELARSKTTAEYREKHPAANAAAEAIVIYPTDRLLK
jgi:hypothetical protein